VSTATMTSKGQITVPVDVRRDLGLHVGSRVNFVKTAPGVYQMVPSRSIKDLKGFFSWSGPPVTLEQMDEAIAQGAVESMGER